jgi:small subunit ribosomal protein S17
MTTKDTTKKNTLTNRRTMSGVVVKRSGDKTVSVEVSRVVVHPLYHKRHVSLKKYLAHDEKNEVEVGDKVVISESRPLSARKRWVVISHTNLKTAKK